MATYKIIVNVHKPAYVIYSLPIEAHTQTDILSNICFMRACKCVIICTGGSVVNHMYTHTLAQWGQSETTTTTTEGLRYKPPSQTRVSYTVLWLITCTCTTIHYAYMYTCVCDIKINWQLITSSANIQYSAQSRRENFSLVWTIL